MIRKVDCPEIVYLKNNDPILSIIIDKIGDLDYELYNDPYRFLVFTIIGQMLSNEVGNKLYMKLENKCNGVITVYSISRLNDDELTAIGISKRKANAIRSLTNLIIKNNHYFDELENKTNEEVINSICSVHGIGSWTAKMFLIFVLDRLDVLPYEDGAFISAYSKIYKFEDKTRDKRKIRKKCKIWGSYSSIAARYLYRYYDSELKYSNEN